MRNRDLLTSELNNDDIALVELAMLALGVIWGISLSGQRYRHLKTLAAVLTYLGCSAKITRRMAKKRKGQ